MSRKLQKRRPGAASDTSYTSYLEPALAQLTAPRSQTSATLSYALQPTPLLASKSIPNRSISEFSYATSADLSDGRTALKSTTAYAESIGPHSYAERYWAARALTAEALLSAGSTGHRRLQSQLDPGRSSSDDLRILHVAQERKRNAIIVGLVAIIIALAALLGYVSARTPAPATVSTFAFHFPSHFSVPILSPFTSVVEHEVSTITPRTFAVAMLFLCILAYGMFRHWTSSRRV